MGNTTSKANELTDDSDKGYKLLNKIATKFILTENFKDLSRLTNSDYCNNLLILTADSINKLMNQRTIEYLYNKKINREKVLFVSQKKTKSSSRDNRSSTSSSGSSSSTDPRVSSSSSSGSSSSSSSESSSSADPRVSSSSSSESSSREASNEKGQTGGSINHYDIQNKDKKYAMCLGIAKFYVTIAHIFSAISLIVNPKYIWTDANGEHEYSIKRRLDIPDDVKMKVSLKDNFCDRRIKALYGQYKDPNTKDELISLSLQNVCNINKKTHTITSADEDEDVEKIGDTVYTVKTLSEETGFSELEKLYYDKYNLETGKFDSMKPGGRGEKDFLQDLKVFYETFTEKSNESFKKWYKAGNKKGPVKRGFADVILEDFGDHSKCGPGGKWKETIKMKDLQPNGINLFQKYAQHIKYMEKTTIEQKDKIISILLEIFKVSLEEDNKSTVVINPALTSDMLQKIVIKTRKAIFELYMKCEKDFKKALELFEAIVIEKQLYGIKEKEKQLEEKLQHIETEDDNSESQDPNQPQVDPNQHQVVPNQPPVDPNLPQAPEESEEDNANPQ